MPIEGQPIDGVFINEDDTNICPSCKADSFRVEYAEMTNLSVLGSTPCAPVTNFLYYQCTDCGQAFHMDNSYFSVIKDRIMLGHAMKAARNVYNPLDRRGKYHVYRGIAKLTHWHEMISCFEYLMAGDGVHPDDHQEYSLIYTKLRHEGRCQWRTTPDNLSIFFNPRFKPERFANMVAERGYQRPQRLQAEINAMVEGMENIEPGRFAEVDSVPPSLRDANPSSLSNSHRPPGYQEAPHVWVGNNEGYAYVTEMEDYARVGRHAMSNQVESYRQLYDHIPVGPNTPRLQQYAEGAADLEERIHRLNNSTEEELIRRYQEETGSISLHPFDYESTVLGQPMTGAYLDEVTTGIETNTTPRLTATQVSESMNILRPYYDPEASNRIAVQRLAEFSTDEELRRMGYTRGGEPLSNYPALESTMREIYEQAFRDNLSPFPMTHTSNDDTTSNNS